MSEHNINICGISSSQANSISFAYEKRMEMTIPLNGFDMHIFFKNDMPCLTLHTRFFNFAMYDFIMFTVGDKRKYDMLIFKSKDKKSNNSLTMFVRKP